MSDRATTYHLEPGESSLSEASAWRDLAACQGRDLWFPAPYDSFTTKVAVRICKRCPVKAECLEEALTWPAKEDYGVWGGKTQAQRARMRSRKVAPVS